MILLRRWPSPAWRSGRTLGAARGSGLAPVAPRGVRRRRRLRRHCTTPTNSMPLRPTRPHGRGSPMTNCSRASSRSRWCARISKRLAGARAAATGVLQARSWAPCPIRSPPRRNARSRTSTPTWRARAHAAAAAGRCRLGQDRRGAARRGDRGRGRPAGGADGADRNPGAPASRDHRAAGRARRPARRDPHRPRSAARTRRYRWHRFAAGEIDLLVGTHALFQDDVVFHDLALAVVDEQHRFGVHQRLALARKGEAVDVLVLTRDADPAHAGPDLFRRHGRLGVAREAGRPAADRHPRDTARAVSTR